MLDRIFTFTATPIVTFVMVVMIQNSQNRDVAAMQARLDELIRAVAARQHRPSRPANMMRYRTMIS